MTFVESMVMLSVIMNFILITTTTLLIVKLLTLNKVVKDVISLVSKSAANNLMTMGRPQMPEYGKEFLPEDSSNKKPARNPLVG